MSKKRIVFLSHSSHLEGAERSLLLLVRRLDGARYDRLVVCPRRGPLCRELEKEGIPHVVSPLTKWVLHAGTWSPSRLKACLGAAERAIRSEADRIAGRLGPAAPDLVVTNTVTISQGALLAERMRVPHLWCIREMLAPDGPFFSPGLSLREMVQHMVRHSDALVFNSGMAKDAFAGVPGLDERDREEIARKAHILFPGVEVSGPVGPGPGPAAGRPVRRVAVIGSVCPNKGQLVAIKAFETVSRDFPNGVLELAGPVRDPGYWLALKRRVRRGLAKKVLFRGFQQDVPAYLAGIDLVLVPSRRESFGRVALESLLAGVPVIISRRAGIAAHLRDGEEALLVSPDSPGELAAALLRILRDDGLRHRLVEQGRKKALELSDPAATAAGFEDILDRTIASAARAAPCPGQ